jgi:hypothetical protein
MQWAWAAAEDEEPEGGGDGGAPGAPPEGPDGGSGGRGTRVALIVGGALALIALLAWVITATLPNSSPHPADVADSSRPSAAPQTSLQSLGAQPFSLASVTGTESVSPSPSAVKTTTAPSPAPTHAVQTTRPQAPQTTQHQQASVTHPATKATTASAAADPAPAATVNVEIADSDDGLVLDVDNSGTSAGTLVGTWSADNSSAQHWHLVLQPNGTYVIYTELMDMKEGLEINTDASDFNGNTVTTLQAYSGSAAMQWTAKSLGSGKYELVNKDNGQCLQGAGQGVANATAACTAGDAHQAWTVTG